VFAYIKHVACKAESEMYVEGELSGYIGELSHTPDVETSYTLPFTSFIDHFDL
jgi:hypothetical protein